MSYVSISAQIKAILDTISEIKSVYNYNEKSLNTYPAAVIVAASHANRFSDLAANQRDYTFKVYIFHPTNTATDAASAESILRTLADALITAVETNVTLNGSCDWAAPTMGSWGYDQREVPVRFIEITIVARKRVNR
jgi:hypothetical protein